MAAVVVPDVESVCTHQDIVDEIGGPEAAEHSLPPGWSDSKAARTNALRETMEALYRRTPPIRLSDLDDVLELKTIVVYRSLERIYRSNVTAAGERWHVLMKEYKGKADTELGSFTPTIGGGMLGVAGSFAMQRR